MFSKIKSLFSKKKPEPNLLDAWSSLKKVKEDFDDFAFYYQMVKRDNVSTQETDYLTKAEFNLSSARDEMRLELERLKFKKLEELIKNGKK